jgi:hypothetical protein
MNALAMSLTDAPQHLRLVARLLRFIRPSFMDPDRTLIFPDSEADFLEALAASIERVTSGTDTTPAQSPLLSLQMTVEQIEMTLAAVVSREGNAAQHGLPTQEAWEQIGSILYKTLLGTPPLQEEENPYG